MEILILSFLILLNGFFALSELALVSSRRAKLIQKKAEGHKGATTALKLLDNSENFLSAIQVGITLIGIVTGVYGGVSIADDITPFFMQFPAILPFAKEIALALTVLIITYISIVVGELVPKTIAIGNPEAIALKVSRPILFFSMAFYPIVKLLSGSTAMLLKTLGVKNSNRQLSEADLKLLLKHASVEGVIEEEQKVMHDKVFYFADKKARHMMTHRTDVEWIDISQPQETIHNELLNAKHSKLLCCKDDPENIEGIVYLKDFYKSLSTNEPFSINDILQKPLFVPENADALKVLELMRQNKTHICCLINEYGSFEGVVTLHDLIENLLGQIPDGREPFEPDLFIRDDKSVLVNGDAPIDVLSDIIENFQVDFEKREYSTVAGFFIDQTGQIPELGAKCEISGFAFEIVDLDGNRIDKILIKRTTPQKKHI